MRALEEEKAGLMERVEEEEEKTRELTRQIQNHTQQVYTHTVIGSPKMDKAVFLY